MEFDVESYGIRDVTRLPTKKENVASSLSVEVCNTLLKTKFLAAVEDYNKHNPHRQDEINPPKLKIYTGNTNLHHRASNC